MTPGASPPRHTACARFENVRPPGASMRQRPVRTQPAACIHFPGVRRSSGGTGTTRHGIHKLFARCENCRIGGEISRQLKQKIGQTPGEDEPIVAPFGKVMAAPIRQSDSTRLQLAMQQVLTCNWFSTGQNLSHTNSSKKVPFMASGLQNDRACPFFLFILKLRLVEQFQNLPQLPLHFRVRSPLANRYVHPYIDFDFPRVLSPVSRGGTVDFWRKWQGRPRP